MNRNSLEYDIIIIGSGAGGGTIAKELSPLCKSGMKIALLEWGGRYRAQDNTREEVKMASQYYFDGGGFLTKSQDMTLAFARALGGSTTVYTGTSLKAPPEVINNKWNIPGLTYEDLLPRYQKYIKENNVHLYPEEELSLNNKLFRDACKKLGWKFDQFPVNTKGCKGQATCNLGCSQLAKQGTSVVQIPEAQKNGVEVITFCRVDFVEGNEVHVEVIPPEYELEPSKLAPGFYKFKASKIVFAAGVMNTPILLQKALGKDAPWALGRYFTCHPAMMLAGEHEKSIQSTFGHPKSFYCDEFVETERFLLETCMYFPFIFSKSLSFFGSDPDEFISHFDRLQMILTLAIDDADPENKIVMNKFGKTEAHYKISEKLKRSLTMSMRASAEILFESGCKRVHMPAASKFFIDRSERSKINEIIDVKNFKTGNVSISAAHLMGGAIMGSDPKNSVTDSFGRVHGFENYYVADASLFPSAVEVNPYLTIMALADRVAEAVKKDMKVN